jgi:hypothetical protein
VYIDVFAGPVGAVSDEIVGHGCLCRLLVDSHCGRWYSFVFLILKKAHVCIRC